MPTHEAEGDEMIIRDADAKAGQIHVSAGTEKESEARRFLKERLGHVAARPPILDREAEG